MIDKYIMHDQDSSSFAGIPTDTTSTTTKRQSKGRNSFCHLETNGFLYISQAIRIQLFEYNNLFLLKDADQDYIHLNYITHPCQDANNPNWIYFDFRSARYKQFAVSSSEKKICARFQIDSKGKERQGAKFGSTKTEWRSNWT
ncbi:hypothetical protein CMK14_14240 [Candidatus Poribacteria bacterium]|nr:hypothetical protein [Candidatus Poribacteria bacterium]